MGVALALVALIGILLIAQAAMIGDPARWAERASVPVRALVGTVRGAPGGDPRRAGFLAAVVVGGVLRLLWVIWATRAPAEPQDPAEYLRIASDFGHGLMPRFGGLDLSAYWPPGYPALLSPFVAVADRTGWISPAFAAALVNVVAGTITIVLTGVLADRWIGRRARNVAAWLIALAPGLLYFTSTAHSETVFTPILLGLIVLAGAAMTEDSRRMWLLTGLLLGAAFLVRSPAVIVLAVPAMVIRTGRGSWAGVGRATGLVALGATVLLVPWMIRNGVQVGVWSPASTNNAAAACFGHHEGVSADWETDLADPQLQVDCFRLSPYDDRRLLPLYAANGDTPAETEGIGTPDEPRWYRERMSAAARWALGHPREELVLSVQKVWATWGDEGRVVDAARNYRQPGWAGRWHSGLGVLANLWLWTVGALALLGLAFVPACRRALPIWGPLGLLTLAIVAGLAEPHYRYPVVPLVAVLAAGFLCQNRVEEVT